MIAPDPNNSVASEVKGMVINKFRKIKQTTKASPV